MSSMTLTQNPDRPVRGKNRRRPPLGLADGPTAAELAEIEAEWPLIEAELAVVDAEIRALTAPGGPSPLDWRRVRRAEARVTRKAAELGVTTNDGGWAA